MAGTIFRSQYRTSQIYSVNRAAYLPRWLIHADLKSLVPKLFEEVAELRRTVAAQRDEIARLKGRPLAEHLNPVAWTRRPSRSRPHGCGRAARYLQQDLQVFRSTTCIRQTRRPAARLSLQGYTYFVVQDP